MTEPNVLRRRAPAALAWLYVVLAPLLAALARLIGHPGYYFDGETQIPPTIGRELLHGHLGDAIHYQIIVYQGSLLWDALLSAGAYVVFGDHLLAWHAVPIGYFVGLSVAGTLLLRRTIGRRWALVFPALLAALPFFVKDGFVSGIGGHAPGAFYAVAGLAAAAHASGEGGKRRYSVLSGLLLGFGAWYVRTVLLAVPAAVVLVGNRIVGRLLLGVGLLAFPLLIAWNVQALADAGTHSAARATSEELTRVVLFGVQGSRPEPVPPARKALEATGPAVRTVLFAQPQRAGTSQQTFRPLAYPAGVGWSAAWIAGAAVPVLLLLLPAARRRPELVRGTLALSTLSVAYVGAYTFSSLNLDPGIVESLRVYPPLPPGVSGGRYLVPIQGVLTLGLAHAIGVVAVALDGRLAGALALPVILLGVLPAVGDWAYDRDPPDLWHHMPPHQYGGAFGPGRGPPLEVHLTCTDPDPESRAAHLDAIGRFFRHPPDPGTDPVPISESVRTLREQGNYRADEIGGLVSSLGGDAARDYASGTLSFSELTAAVFENARLFGPEVGENYLMGVRRGLMNTPPTAAPADVVRGLCARGPSGTRPLCALAGEQLAIAPSAWPPTPEGLFRSGMPPFAGLDRPVRDSLLYGAAARWAETTTLPLPAAGPPGWDPDDARVFVQKWRLKGGRTTP